jgi:hypothetical protein
VRRAFDAVLEQLPNRQRRLTFSHIIMVTRTNFEANGNTYPDARRALTSMRFPSLPRARRYTPGDLASSDYDTTVTQISGSKLETCIFREQVARTKGGGWFHGPTLMAKLNSRTIDPVPITTQIKAHANRNRACK